MAIQGLGVGCNRKNSSDVIKATSFILVRTDYFTKWVEAVPLKNATQKEANGLAEAANKIVIGIIQKMVEENPRKWHALLPQALWAHRNSRNTSTGFSPYQLTFRQDAVLPAEFVVSSPRVTNTIVSNDEACIQAIWQQLEEVDTDQLNALDRVVRQNEIRAKYYGKRVYPKSFAEGDLVWKTILPTYKKGDQLRKWSPNWEGPFIIHKAIGNRAFIIVNQEGKLVHENFNAKYLKRNPFKGFEPAGKGSLIIIRKGDTRVIAFWFRGLVLCGLSCLVKIGFLVQQEHAAWRVLMVEIRNAGKYINKGFITGGYAFH
ncbi:uncharacterized protein LOC127256892 [Andrographis paniculata]|uniref:uncharacterized protein LOC127256892 n=1 Tax=Andrographis paniculata TaxID=175694 RepID=UPI0021E75EAB|nr:uncharacterized protein LOC127256892 [Andrographis paniculata]